MTGDAAILQNYKPSNGHSSVHIADGSKSKIAGTGLEIGKMIGSAELCSGLYLLSCGHSPTKSLQQVAYSLRSHQILPNSRPLSLSTPMPPSVQPAQLTNVPSPVTIQSPMPIQPIAPQLANENLQVYIRRRKRQELEHGSQSTCGQYIDSNSSLPEENIGSQHNTRGIKNFRMKNAVQDEIDALEKNGTWTITDLPLERPVGSFSHWLSIKIGACNNWDIKNAFLNGDLERKSTWKYHPGFEESMAKNQADHTLFVKKSHAGKLAILIVYVDDIILSGNDMGELQNLKKYLSEEFEVKDLGN
ncbi:hypothetical protein CK203_078121 [Vitis vinifera]|uniref:Reverse transcriptase Ty1/copia-type domain-containing protein n=1 Tax=Vitis vinifera TaxID=29760 RepID=A0A438ETP1_VITVI|nr:hypothetical protein CK203_078121 [Vitis vinifera]